MRLRRDQEQMKRVICASFIVLGAASLYFGCTVKEPCDPGQTLVFGQCQAPPEEMGDGDGETDTEDPGGDGDSTGDGDNTSGGGESGGGGSTGGGGDGGTLGNSDTSDADSGDTDDTSDTDEPTDPPNFGATCDDQTDCTGGTVCAAPQLPQCIGMCGSGDPFEDSCPDGTTCTEAQPGIFVCL